ncbi:MAG: hypothetical protein ACXVZ2_14185, partial [Gaiellaceae bacterium]
MAADHERAWAEGLAQEQAHQQELLATFRGELATFARECAAALTALDTVAGGVGDLAQVLTTAQKSQQHAKLVLDVGRRLAKARPSQEDAEVVESFAAPGDLPGKVVHHARETLKKEPTRSDRELLQAIANTAGARAQIEAVLGPAPIAALAALAPLGKHIPRLRAAEEQEAQASRKELAGALNPAATGVADAGGVVEVSAVTSLFDSLRAAADHASASVRAAEQGRIAEVIAQARRQLEQDLEGLKGVLHGSPDDWRSEREPEHTALAEEVREKLERLERLRGWLLALAPRLQLIARGLSTANRIESVEGHFTEHHAVVAEAARLSLLLELATIWKPLLSRERAAAGHEPLAPERSRVPRKRVLVAAIAAALAAAGVAIGFAVSGGGGSSSTNAAAGSSASSTGSTSASTSSTSSTASTGTETGQTTTEPAIPPKITAMSAVFVPAKKLTRYSAKLLKPGAKAKFQWGLQPPKNDKTCFHFFLDPGGESMAWHHA